MRTKAVCGWSLMASVASKLVGLNRRVMEIRHPPNLLYTLPPLTTQRIDTSPDTRLQLSTILPWSVSTKIFFVTWAFAIFLSHTESYSKLGKLCLYYEKWTFLISFSIITLKLSVIICEPVVEFQFACLMRQIGSGTSGVWCFLQMLNASVAATGAVIPNYWNPWNVLEHWGQKISRAPGPTLFDWH